MLLTTTRWCQVSKKIMPKIFSRKVTQVSTFSGPYNIPVSKYKSAPYHHQVVSGVKKIIPKIFSRKVTQVGTFSGPYNIPVSKLKNYSLPPPGGVRCQKKIMPKIFSSKGTPSNTFWKVNYGHFSRNRNLPVLSVITGQPVGGLEQW